MVYVALQAVAYVSVALEGALQKKCGVQVRLYSFWIVMYLIEQE